MLQNFQRLGQGQRLVIFILIMVGGIALLVGATLFLIFSSISAEGRRAAVSLAENVTVREFAALPDNDSYPAAVAVALDGTVYTGSYKTGAIWKITPAGEVAEIEGTRNLLGAVAGLTVAPDGTVYIVDQVDADPRTGGGSVKKLAPDGTISDFATIADERGFVAVDDVALDPAGNLYVSDRGRDEVWQFAADGTGAVWWTPPKIDGVDSYEPTGLAYDADTDALIVTDGLNNIIYSVSLEDKTTTTLYEHGTRPDAPGFDGVTVTPEGVIYAAALGQNGIIRLDDGALTYIAGLFRGASDVDYSAVNNRLYVSNFDSFSLVVSATQPRLPFAIDVIEFGTQP